MNRLEKNQKWNDTDYDIPKFSYKSAFLITFVTFFVTAFAIYFSNGNKLCILLTLSLSLSLTTAYSRYFIDTKRGMGKDFLKTFLLLFLACAVVLYFVQF